jgi:ribosome-associated toxin RatA of RatAB toxin-antitoxin module
MLKKIGIALVIILAILAVVPAFLPKKTHVERSAEVNAPAAKVFTVISDLNQFSRWNPWAEMEPTAKIEVAGQGIGATYSWAGQKTRSGKMTVIGMTADTNVDVKMDFTEPMASEAQSQWTITPTGENTSKVTWAFDQELAYLHRFFGLTMDKMMGPSFEKGLENLKKMVE